MYDQFRPASMDSPSGYGPGRTSRGELRDGDPQPYYGVSYSFFLVATPLDVSDSIHARQGPPGDPPGVDLSASAWQERVLHP